MSDIKDTCANCHWDQVEHLKASHPTCAGCLRDGTKECPFPNWKKVEVT